MLGGCGEENKSDGIFKSFGFGSNPPVEFAVIPHRPLEVPESLAELPAPRPGTRNRTDLTPVEDALVALGGSPNGGVSTQSDAAILAATGAGQSPDAIRLVLAQEDADYRHRNRGKLMERLFNKATESSVYDDVLLQQYNEALRMRLSGQRTPEIPLPNTE